MGGELIFGRNGAGSGLEVLDTVITRPAVARRADLAGRAFRLVFAFTAANAIFNVLAGAVGLGFPHDTFLFSPADRFGDYFKFILSYPGGEGVRPTELFGLADLVAGYTRDNPYRGLEGLAAGGNTHLHVTPLTTLFALANLRTMSIVDPVALFVVVNLAIVGWLGAVFIGASVSRREAWAWIGTALLSYPMLCMLTRGNVYAGIAAVLLVQAMILSMRGHAPSLAAILLALAINIRPNAVLFALPLIGFAPAHRARTGAILAICVALIFAVSLAAAHRLYPDYTVTTFLAGLERYYRIYVQGHEGLAYGSSLYGGLTVLFGTAPGLETASALIALAIGGGAVFMLATRRIGRAAFLFLISAAYCLGSTVLADYHLLLFVAPTIGLALERAARAPEPGPDVAPAVLLACCLMLSPKNYVFIGSVSWQVALNPLILLCAAVSILERAVRWSPPRTAPAERFTAPAVGEAGCRAA